MISNNLNSHDDLFEVLEGYAAATPDGNEKSILDQWIEEHPMYAQDLMEFAANREMLAYRSSEGFESEDRKQEYIRRSISTYNRFVESSRGKNFSALKSIIKRAAELDLKKNELTQRLGISITLLNSLENRAIDYSSIPKAFLVRVSEVIQVHLDSVAAFFQLPRVGAEFHKNHTRPDELKTVNFYDAVKADYGLTEEQKKHLLSITSEQ